MKFKVSSLIQGSLEGLEYVFGYSLHTFGDRDPLHKVPFRSATTRVKKGPV